MPSHIGCIFVFFSRVSFQMCSQIACLYRCKVALVAFVCFFNCLLKLSAQTDAKSHLLHLYAFLKWLFKCVLKLSACTDAKSHWLHLNNFSPEGVFRCLLKWPAWLDAKLQMVAFIHFFSSTVSSNYLPEQMQSGIGCICPLFLQSKSSNGQNSNPCTGSLILGSLVLGFSVLGLRILSPRIEDPQSWDYGSLVLGLRILSPRIEDP